MVIKNSAYYQREYRKRLRDKGLVKKEIWILPDNTNRLLELEQLLRQPWADKSIGSIAMSELQKNNDVWTTESIHSALNGRDLGFGDKATVEYIDGIDPSVLITMHDYGDLPIFMTVSASQILVESVLWSVEDVIDTAEFNTFILKAHKYIPLSTIAIEGNAEYGDYYHMFGALSSQSTIEDVLHEIEVLAENVIQATEGFRDFLKG